MNVNGFWTAKRLFNEKMACQPKKMNRKAARVEQVTMPSPGTTYSPHHAIALLANMADDLRVGTTKAWNQKP